VKVEIALGADRAAAQGTPMAVAVERMLFDLMARGLLAVSRV
jgi:hypothetical protein